MKSGKKHVEPARFGGALEFLLYSFRWPFTAATLQIRPERLTLKRRLGRDVTVPRAGSSVEMVRNRGPFVVPAVVKIRTQRETLYFHAWRPVRVEKALAEADWISRVCELES